MVQVLLGTFSIVKKKVMSIGPRSRPRSSGLPIKHHLRGNIQAVGAGHNTFVASCTGCYLLQFTITINGCTISLYKRETGIHKYLQYWIYWTSLPSTSVAAIAAPCTAVAMELLDSSEQLHMPARTAGSQSSSPHCAQQTKHLDCLCPQVPSESCGIGAVAIKLIHFVQTYGIFCGRLNRSFHPIPLINM